MSGGRASTPRRAQHYTVCARPMHLHHRRRSRIARTVLAFGINDCGTHWPEDLEEIVDKVLDAAHELYVKAGARNFLFLDVPPIDRSSRGTFPFRQCRKLPDGRSVQRMGLAELMAPRYAAWNTLLGAQVSHFASSTPKANVFLFSQYHVLSRIIDGPGVYGLAGEDEIWADELHLTEETHRIFAGEVFKTLFSES
jgi:hypothetical protein